MSDVSSTRSLQAKLADLHIFVVPVALWLDKYRTAFNNIALESVSAGFVRVHPDLSLHHLRESLDEQLGEDIIPEEFVFLRSVGRCMAIVKENQERLLKAKDFLPPVAYSPEVFVLPGSHETYARPSTDSNNVVIATQGHTTAGMSTTNQFQLPLIPPQHNLVAQPNQQGYHGNQFEKEDNYGFHRNDQTDYDPNDKRGQLLQAQRNSFDSEPTSNSLEDNSDGYHGNNTRRSSHDSGDSGYTPGRTNKVKPITEEQDVGRASPANEHKTVKIIEPHLEPSFPYQGPDGHLIAPPTPIPTGRVIASPMPEPQKSKAENTTGKENKRKTKKNKKHRSRSSSLDKKENADTAVIPTIEDVEDRSKYAQFPSPIKTTRPYNPYANENGMDSGIADDPLDSSQELNKSLNGSNRDKENLNVDKELDNMENLNVINGGGSAGETAEVKTEENGPFDSTTKNNINKNKSTLKDSKNPIRKPKKPAKKVAKKPSDDLEEKLRKLKTVEPPPIAVPDPGSVTFERDTHSSKERKQKIIEDFRGQLRKAKNERVDLEKQRDQKVRRAKSLQTQTLQKRNQAKNIWKKKFFDEKRKTAPLEEQLNRLRYDVEVQHKAIVDLLENKDRDGHKGSKDQDNTPSEKTNQLMLLARIQNEVEEQKHKLEELKMRLASEMKLRDNAQSELKQLREDLIERKINLTLTKSQRSLVVVNPANITAQ